MTRALCLCVVSAFAFGLSGCFGPERSAAAWCDAYWDKAIPIHDGYQEHADMAEEDPFPIILDVFALPGDMAVVLDDMAKVAPEEIRSDTEALRDSMKKLAETEGKAFSDPLGALGDGIGNALSTMGSSRRVDEYFSRHCGTPADARAARQ
jgi:hypothetical protein